MSIPIVCESASIYRWKKICREGSVEKRSHSFSLHFYVSHTMEYFDKIRKVLRFLAECSSWIAIRRRDPDNKTLVKELVKKRDAG